MTRSRLAVAGFGCTVALIAGWLLGRTHDPPPAPLTPADADSRTGGEPTTAIAEADPVAGSRNDPAGMRESAPAPAGPIVADRALHVRLRGLLPSAPWTATLGLRWQGHTLSGERKEHEAREEVGDDGTCTFALPEFVPTATTRAWRFSARDPNYLPLEERIERDLVLDDELVLDVQAVATFSGRVVDARGGPVAAAKVTAFGLREGQPTPPALGTTNTFFDGSYRLRVPPDTPLFVVAVAMQPAELSGQKLTGEDGIATLGTARPGLRPAACRATGMLGSPRELPNLVLADVPTIEGLVQWADRTPIADAVLCWLPPETGDRGLPIADHSGVRLTADGGLELGASATSAVDGSFTLPWLASGTHRLWLVRLPGTVLLADVLTPAFPPPARTVIAVPLPTTVRALRGGAPVRGATIEVADVVHRADAEGRLRIVAGVEFPVVASDGRGRSAPVSIGPAQSGHTVDLELVDALTRVAVEFTGDIRVRNATFAWRRDDGTTGRSHAMRDDRGDPFELFLEPGHYTLRVGPAAGERNGLYLLPIERELDVGAAELRIDLPAAFGGTFTLQVTDGAGRPVGGSCRVRAANGDDVTATFLSATGQFDDPGVFTEEAPSRFSRILPPGTYGFELTFAEVGVQRTQVAIRARETTEVRLRLP